MTKLLQTQPSGDRAGDGQPEMEIESRSVRHAHERSGGQGRRAQRTLQKNRLPRWSEAFTIKTTEGPLWN